ncbi:MAG: inositol monophosphatase family protein [Candidatus Odinarchaeota archaeon]
MSLYNRELKFAIDMVRNAALITQWFRKKGVQSLSFKKDDQSPVTIADFASQLYLVSQIREFFQDDQIIAEEENTEFIDLKAENMIKQCFEEIDIDKIDNYKGNIKYKGKSSERQWTIDPIDGTMGYQKGLYYAIGLGFMINSIPKVCAIAVPDYNNYPLAIFAAEEGQGSRISYNNKNFNPIRVNQNENINNIRLCHSLHYDQPWVLDFAKKIGIKNYIQIDSMAKFCMVADGTADLYIKPLDPNKSFSWDFMPGDLLVREAGGRVTDLNGERLKFSERKCLWTKPGIIASNGIFQKKILELIKENLSN